MGPNNIVELQINENEIYNDPTEIPDILNKFHVKSIECISITKSIDRAGPDFLTMILF